MATRQRKKTALQQANSNANAVGVTSSVQGRMSDGRTNPKTGNKLASGMGRSFSTGTGKGDMGRGNLKVSRRKRYYDVRVGLGLAGG